MLFCFNVLKVKPILDAFDGRWNIYSKIPRPESARRSLQWIFRRYESVFLARAKARGLQRGLVDPEEFWFFSVGVWSSGTCFFWGFKRNCVPRELWRFPQACLCYLRWHSLWCPGPKRSFRTGNLEPCRRWVMSVWLLRRAETLWDHRSRNAGRGYRSGEGEMCFFGCGMDMSQHLLLST